MPVVTRSCGKQAPRRRIEDPTPRTCKTTAKRRKEMSDEEDERPPKKKPIMCDKTPCNTNKRSRIPRRRLAEKNSAKTKIQISHDKDDNDDDDNEIQFKTTAEVNKMETQQAATVQCAAQQTPFKSPVAARTRSYSALKRSYKRKKKNQEVINKPNDVEVSLISTPTESDMFEDAVEDSRQEREKEDEAPYVKEVNSSTCNDENDHRVNSNDQEKNDQYYKNKFHEMVQNLKQMQEQFSQAHQNTHKNITAYDTFIKELKNSLEQEKRKNATIEEQLKETREQLQMSQKEIESAKTNEQQNNSNNNRSISTTCISQEPSQREDRSPQSKVEELEKADSSTLLAMIKFYAGLTGITLSTDVPPSNSELIESFCCAYRPQGPNGDVMQFRLTHDKEFEEYEYSPSFQTPKRKEFLHKIPRYLKENMYFNSDQVQSFLSSLIKVVQNPQ